MGHLVGEHPEPGRARRVEGRVDVDIIAVGQTQDPESARRGDGDVVGVEPDSGQVGAEAALEAAGVITFVWGKLER